DAGISWSPAETVSDAVRPQSHDTADHDFPMIAATDSGRVCVAWEDDRRGALDMWTRCSIDRGEHWGRDALLSNRADGAAYKSPLGFKAFYGHYGGIAIDTRGRLHATWGEGEPGYRSGATWFNSVDIAPTIK